MNLCVLSGRLGHDPQDRRTQSGEAFAAFSIAVSNGANRPAQWWDVTAYGANRESVLKNLHKGDSVVVYGRASASAWNDRDTGAARVSQRLNLTYWEYGRGSAQGVQAAAEQGAPEAAEPQPVDPPEDLPY